MKNLPFEQIMSAKTEKDEIWSLFVYGTLRDDDVGNVEDASDEEDDDKDETNEFEAQYAKLYGFKMYQHKDQSFPFATKVNDINCFIIGRYLKYKSKETFLKILAMTDKLEGYDPNSDNNAYTREIVKVYISSKDTEHDPQNISKENGFLKKAFAYYQNNKSINEMLSDCYEMPDGDWIKRKLIEKSVDDHK